MPPTDRPDGGNEYGPVLLSLDVLDPFHGDIVQPFFPQLCSYPHNLNESIVRSANVTSSHYQTFYFVAQSLLYFAEIWSRPFSPNSK